MAVLRVVQVGLGPIGIAVARLAREKTGVELMGAADPRHVGRDLGEMLGGPATGQLVEPDTQRLLERLRPDVVLHATGSYLTDVVDQLRACMSGGACVVSTCEELAYPFYRHPTLARDLGAFALDRGAVLLGTGVNPGFIMDKVVATLLAACTHVESLRVTRVVDASKRREPLQRKIGAGLTREQFDEAARTGRFGHVGLPESAHLLADVLGLPPEREVVEKLRPVIAQEDVPAAHVSVKPGDVAGIDQSTKIRVGGEERLSLHLRMAVGAADPRDAVSVTGTPPLEMTLAGGVQGDIGTAGVTVHAALAARELSPGLRTMLDVPLRYRP